MFGRHLLLLCGTLLLTINAEPSTTTATAPLRFETREEWHAHKPEVRKFWENVLGENPEHVPLSAEVVSTTTETDHVRQLVRYNVEGGVRTDAYVLRPLKVSEKLPAAVVFHATSSNHILQPVGLADKETRHLALYLVRRGYITISPRCYIYGVPDENATTAPATPARATKDYAAAAGDLMKRRPGWSGMGKMLWDGMRAVEYLATLENVDTSCIIAVGHSLGAKEVLYLAAFDERVAGGIFSEGGLGLEHSNWDAVWYLGKRAADLKGHDHHELLMLIAPRPFIIVGGESADGTKTIPLVEQARGIYQLHGAREALKLNLHKEGHNIPEAEREKAFDKIELELAGRKSGTGFAE